MKPAPWRHAPPVAVAVAATVVVATVVAVVVTAAVVAAVAAATAVAVKAVVVATAVVAVKAAVAVVSVAPTALAHAAVAVVVAAVAVATVVAATATDPQRCTQHGRFQPSQSKALQGLFLCPPAAGAGHAPRSTRRAPRRLEFTAHPALHVQHLGEVVKLHAVGTEAVALTQ